MCLHRGVTCLALLIFQSIQQVYYTRLCAVKALAWFRAVYTGWAVSRAADGCFLPNTAGTDGDPAPCHLSPSSSRFLHLHLLPRCSLAHPLGYFTGVWHQGPVWGQSGRTVAVNGLLQIVSDKGLGRSNGANVCQLNLCLWCKCTVIKQTDKNSSKSM